MPEGAHYPLTQLENISLQKYLSAPIEAEDNVQLHLVPPDTVPPPISPKVVREGSDVTIVAVGDMLKNALMAAEVLSENGISAEVIDLRVIKPLKMELIIKSLQKTSKIVTIENNITTGGAGERILCELLESSIDGNFKSKILALPNEIIPQMPVDRIFENYVLDVSGIAQAVTSILNSHET